MYLWRQAEMLRWSIMNQAVQSGETPGGYKLAHMAARAGDLSAPSQFLVPLLLRLHGGVNHQLAEDVSLETRVGKR